MKTNNKDYSLVVKSVLTYRQSADKMDSNLLAERLRSLLINEKYTDCCFLIGARQIKCHKIILTAASKVFEAMFFGEYAKSQKNQDCVQIKDVSFNSFQTMIAFVYTNNITDTANLSIYELIELYYCGEKYLLEDLVRIVLEIISERLNDSNLLLVIYDFAIKFSVISLIGECRSMFKSLLNTKSAFFFKRTLNLQCKNVIDYYNEEEVRCGDGGKEDSESESDRSLEAVSERGLNLDDLDFSTENNERNDDDHYHQVSKKCLNDILMHTYDKRNKTFSDNLILFIVKWLKIELKLEKPNCRFVITDKNLDNYFGFVCDNLRLELINGLLAYLNNHKFLNYKKNAPSNGWYLMQRIDLKASQPLNVYHKNVTQFGSKLFVNQLVTIKSFVINSRFHDIVQSKLIRRHTYNEDVSLEIFCENSRIFHQHFLIEDVEFNSQCELFLNKFVYFVPGIEYTVNFVWNNSERLQYPRKIFETSQNLMIGDKNLSFLFVDDIWSEEAKDNYIANGSIIAGLHFMFLN